MNSMWNKCINRYQLFADLKTLGIGNGHDLPLDLSFESGAFPLFQRDRVTPVGFLPLKIVPSNGRKHRISVQCSMCGEWVPFGRYHQHWTRKDHQ